MTGEYAKNMLVGHDNDDGDDDDDDVEEEEKKLEDCKHYFSFQGR